MNPETRFAIVDINRNFHHVMRGVLRAMGYRKVDCFVGGNEARDFLIHAHCDFAFVDLTLADCSGHELIHALRHERMANPMMPIVLLTSLTSKRNIQQAIAAGADYVLAKPISPKILDQRIQTLLAHPPTYIWTADGYFGPDPMRAIRKTPVVTKASDKANPGIKLSTATRTPHREVARARAETDADLTYLD